jgi:hypothetical protein
MGLNTKTYWLTDRQSQCDFDLIWGDPGSSRREFTEEYSVVYLRLFKSFKWQPREVCRVNWRLYLECVIQTMCDEGYDR